MRWVCGAYNSSRKAIDGQSKDNPENKKAVVELKKNLNEYKAAVRNNGLQVQIKEGQGRSALGKSLHTERAQQLAHSFVSFTAEVVDGVAFNTDVHWMGEGEYVAYTTGSPRG